MTITAVPSSGYPYGAYNYEGKNAAKAFSQVLNAVSFRKIFMPVLISVYLPDDRELPAVFL